VKGPRLFLVAVVCLWLAGGCQEGLAPRLSLGGASPDFLLIVVAVLGLHCGRRSGAALGFSAGMIEGALAGANLSSYAVTRTIAGFACAYVSSLEFELSVAVAGIVAAMVTILAQISLMFVSPPSAILPFVLATIGSAVVNGVLAMPLHMLIKRLSDPYSR
jgi:cell shape-determining protein MreD